MKKRPEPKFKKGQVVNVHGCSEWGSEAKGDDWHSVETVDSVVWMTYAELDGRGYEPWELTKEVRRQGGVWTYDVDDTYLYFAWDLKPLRRDQIGPEVVDRLYHII